jgi:DNA primase
VRRFKIGWAPDGWDALWRELKISDDLMRDAGLGYVNDRNRKRDSFRARIMFPIFDAGDRPVAFGGRILPDATYEGPKYKNSAETPIYSKNRILYGLNWAKTGIVDSGEVVVCEGYTDVIGMFLAGVPRAVATCGTALADGHFRLLKNFARRVVLAYDADAAGQAAAEKFHGWERQYEMDIFVAALPKGADPGDVARTDPGALRTAVEEAAPFMRFRVERVLAARDLTRAEGRARAAEEALLVIAEHPHQLVRDQYVTLVAERCRIEPAELRRVMGDPEALRRLAAQGGEQGARDGRAGSTATRQREGSDERDERGTARRPRRGVRGTLVELDALRLAVHRPEEVADRLEEVLFLDPLNQSAFVRLASSETLHEAIDSAEPEVGGLLARLAVEESEEDAEETIATLVWAAASRAEAQLRSESHAADERFAEIAQTLGWLKLEMEALAQAEERVEASRRLVAWLAERGEGDK